MIKNKNISILYKIIIVIIGGYGLYINFWKANGKFDVELVYYFTDQSNILVFVYFILDIIFIIKSGKTLLPRFKGIVIMAITVTFLIYNFLLRPHNFVMGGYMSKYYYIENTILHCSIPIMTIFDWILFDKKGVYHIIDPLLWLIMPLVYFIFTVVRARVGQRFSDGSRYPYFFIDVDKYGLVGVLRNVILLTIFFLIFGYAVYLVDKFLSRFQNKYNI